MRSMVEFHAYDDGGSFPIHHWIGSVTSDNLDSAIRLLIMRHPSTLCIRYWDDGEQHVAWTAKSGSLMTDNEGGPEAIKITR